MKGESGLSVREFKCPHCGGIMHFSPEDGKVTCEYCESEFSAADLEQYAAVLEEKVEDRMDWAQPDESHTAQESTIYTCPACGGEIITDDVQAATRCPYCDTPAVMTSRVSGVFEPDMIIPFSVTKEQAQQAYRDFCRKKPQMHGLLSFFGTKMEKNVFFSELRLTNRETGVCYRHLHKIR